MKTRTGFVSNSSTASFVICKKFLKSEQSVQRIIDWYTQKSNETYMDDCGSCIKNDQNYIYGTIAYVKDDFWKLMEKMDIKKDEIIIIEE